MDYYFFHMHCSAKSDNIISIDTEKQFLELMTSTDKTAKTTANYIFTYFDLRRTIIDRTDIHDNNHHTTQYTYVTYKSIIIFYCQ